MLHDRISGTISDTPRSSSHRVRLLVAPLAANLDIASAGAAAAQPHLHQPCKDGHGAGNPHEGEHGDADLRADVQLSHATNSVLEDDEHDGCENGGDGGNEGVEEGKDGDGEREPAREDRNGHYEDKDEGENSAGQKEAEHPVGHKPNKIEDVIDVGRQVDCNMLDIR